MYFIRLFHVEFYERKEKLQILESRIFLLNFRRMTMLRFGDYR